MASKAITARFSVLRARRSYLADVLGIFSSRTAACHAKVAITMADCVNSLSLIRSGKSTLVWRVRSSYASKSLIALKPGSPTALKATWSVLPMPSMMFRVAPRSSSGSSHASKIAFAA